MDGEQCDACDPRLTNEQLVMELRLVDPPVGQTVQTGRAMPM